MSVDLVPGTTVPRWLMGRIDEQAARIRAVDRTREELKRDLRLAQEAGATIAQLQEWTGYSRRTIFYMLKENTK